MFDRWMEVVHLGEFVQCNYFSLSKSNFFLGTSGTITWNAIRSQKFIWEFQEHEQTYRHIPSILGLIRRRMEVKKKEKMKADKAKQTTENSVFRYSFRDQFCKIFFRNYFENKTIHHFISYLVSNENSFQEFKNIFLMLVISRKIYIKQVSKTVKQTNFWKIYCKSYLKTSTKHCETSNIFREINYYQKFWRDLITHIYIRTCLLYNLVTELGKNKNKNRR